ncbi:MAG: hypothetical protein AVDCRST_MAG26-3644, partial [uncultured Chloroflexia bacterium]
APSLSDRPGAAADRQFPQPAFLWGTGGAALFRRARHYQLHRRTLPRVLGAKRRARRLWLSHHRGYDRDHCRGQLSHTVFRAQQIRAAPREGTSLRCSTGAPGRRPSAAAGPRLARVRAGERGGGVPLLRRD